MIDQEEAQSVQSSDLSSASAGSAKCFLPNTALAGAGSAEGHLLRVEHLKPGDKVRLSDGTEASVLDVKRHPSKRRPYDVMELSTHQGKFPVSDSHHVAVPGVAGLPRATRVSACRVMLSLLASVCFVVAGRFRKHEVSQGINNCQFPS